MGAAGLLTGRRAACHWAWREFLPVFGAIVDEGRIVRDGNILSGGGVTAGIDFVLALIAELREPRVAEMVQLGLEYAPQPPFDSGRPDTAPAEVLEAVNARTAAAFAERRVRIDAWAAAHRREHTLRLYFVGYAQRRLMIVEGLALLRLAEQRGLTTESDYRYCPSLARRPMEIPFPGE